MLLFPGEESAYIHRSDCTLRPTPLGTLLLCQGTCRRMERPLSCRMFPLLPLLRPDGVKVAMDARSAAVCPLYRAGRRGLSPAFVEAVRACGQLLAEDPQQRGFLVSLTAQQDEWRALQASFGSARKEKRAHV